MPKKGVVPPHLRKYLFRKKGTRRRPARTRTKKRMVVRTARRRYGRRRGGGSRKIPILSFAILGGQAYLAYVRSGGDWGKGVAEFSRFYTGFSPITGKFDASQLAIGYGPWLAKAFIGKIARPRIRGLPVSMS